MLILCAQVMLLKMSMTRCCETARLSMRSFNYPIKLLVFPLQNILLGHAAEGMTGSRSAWNQALHTKFTRIRHVCC